MTIDNDYDRFHGMLKFQPLVEAVIVIVTSHRPDVKGFCSLFLNSYLQKKHPNGQGLSDIYLTSNLY